MGCSKGLRERVRLLASQSVHQITMKTALFVAVFAVAACAKPSDIAELFGIKPHELNNICDLGPCVNSMCPNVNGIQYWCCPYNGYCCRNIPMMATAEKGACVDKKSLATGTSDCEAKKHLCNDVNYGILMKDECPKTCGLC